MWRLDWRAATDQLLALLYSGPSYHLVQLPSFAAVHPELQPLPRCRRLMEERRLISAQQLGPLATVRGLQYASERNGWRVQALSYNKEKDRFAVQEVGDAWDERGDSQQSNSFYVKRANLAFDRGTENEWERIRSKELAEPDGSRRIQAGEWGTLSDGQGSPTFWIEAVSPVRSSPSKDQQLFTLLRVDNAKFEAEYPAYRGIRMLSRGSSAHLPKGATLVAAWRVTRHLASKTAAAHRQNGGITTP